MKGYAGNTFEKYVKVKNYFLENEKEEQTRKGITSRIFQYGPNITG
jgi:hypothetical protein